MPTRVLDRRTVAAHRRRIERARTTAELWLAVRLRTDVGEQEAETALPRQSAQRAKSLLGLAGESDTGGRQQPVGAGSRTKQRRTKRKKSGPASGSRANPEPQLSPRMVRQIPAGAIPAARSPFSAARLEAADGRVVRGQADTGPIADVLDIATGLAGILRG